MAGGYDSQRPEAAVLRPGRLTRLSYVDQVGLQRRAAGRPDSSPNNQPLERTGVAGMMIRGCRVGVCRPGR